MNHFETSLQHILAEMARLDLYIRIQVWRARQQHERAASDLPAFYIPETEVDTLLEKIVGAPTWATVPLPDEQQVTIQEQIDEMAAATAQRVTASLEAGIPLRLVALAHLFDLTHVDLDVILICLAPELDRRYERLYAYLHDDVTRRHPTVDLVLNLLGGDLETNVALRGRFNATAPLMQHQLVTLANPSNQQCPSLLGKDVQLEPRVVQFLLKDDELDNRLCGVVTVTREAVPLGQLFFPDIFHQRLARLGQQIALQQKNLIIYCQGSYGLGKESTAAALCQPLHLGLLVVNGQQLAQQTLAEFAKFIRLIDREARLVGAAIYWKNFDALLSDEKQPHLDTLLAMLDAHPGPTFLAGDTPWEPADALPNVDFQRVVFPQPGFAERSKLWARLLSTPLQLSARGGGLDLDAIANRFRLSGGQIHDAAATALAVAQARDPANPQLAQDDLYAACRLQSNRKLAELAQQITPHYQWDDLVLPEAQKALLRDIYHQVAHRTLVYETWGFDRKLAMGKGLNVLFAGPPGTGKTMAADVLAHALGLDLYKIDLSTVVSKYIGETEKNLARIFAEARSSNAILFFDEADALFGKRTAVKDAHDRYANVEISYLLQKMEEYEGVVILATNLRKNMDDAFVRRLHFIIDFPLPDAEQRCRIWTQIWPDAMPCAPDLDLELLAERIEVAGGNIRNIALASAFLAAADGGVVTMPHLIQATQREYQKMGKVLTKWEFGDYTE